MHTGPPTPELFTDSPHRNINSGHRPTVSTSILENTSRVVGKEENTSGVEGSNGLRVRVSGQTTHCFALFWCVIDRFLLLLHRDQPPQQSIPCQHIKAFHTTITVFSSITPKYSRRSGECPGPDNKEHKMNIDHYNITSFDGLIEMTVAVRDDLYQDLDNNVSCIDLDNNDLIVVQGWNFEWELI